MWRYWSSAAIGSAQYATTTRVSDSSGRAREIEQGTEGGVALLRILSFTSRTERGRVRPAGRLDRLRGSTWT